MDISVHKVVKSEPVFAVNLVNRTQIGDQRAEAEFVTFHSDILKSILIGDTQKPDTSRDYYKINLLIAFEESRAGDIRIYARIANDRPATAFNFYERFRISEPYHTVGETFSSKL